ncbi:MAG: hypothetical protein RLY86_2750 [Pseudomonadota bacterium]|jgi:hypothetical protein
MIPKVGNPDRWYDGDRRSTTRAATPKATGWPPGI